MARCRRPPVRPRTLPARGARRDRLDRRLLGVAAGSTRALRRRAGGDRGPASRRRAGDPRIARGGAWRSRADHRSGADALAASGVLCVLPGQCLRSFDPRRIAQRRPRDPGNAVDDVAGGDRARGDRRRLAPPAPRPSRSLPARWRWRRDDPRLRLERPALLPRGRPRARGGQWHGAMPGLRQCRCPFERREGGKDRWLSPCGHPPNRHRQRRPAPPRSPRGRDARRCGRGPSPLLRRGHCRHDRTGGDRPGGGHRHDRPPLRRLAPCRRRLGRDGRDLLGTPPDDRRRRRAR